MVLSSISIRRLIPILKYNIKVKQNDIRISYYVNDVSVFYFIYRFYLYVRFLYSIRV